MVEDDSKIAGAILQRAIDKKVDHNGAIATIDEMIREVFGEAPTGDQRVATFRAAAELSEVGLIHFPHEKFIWDATRDPVLGAAERVTLFVWLEGNPDLRTVRQLCKRHAARGRDRGAAWRGRWQRVSRKQESLGRLSLIRATGWREAWRRRRWHATNRDKAEQLLGGGLITGKIVGLSRHAVERYQQRFEPTVDFRTAKKNLYLLVHRASYTRECPAWLVHAGEAESGPSTSTLAFWWSTKL